MRKIASLFWGAIVEVPILGPVLIIVNAWLHDGADDFLSSFPGIKTIAKKIGVFFVLSLSGSYWFLMQFIELEEKPQKASMKMIMDVGLQIFPSMLGMGLSIFLLLFSINFVSSENSKKSQEEIKSDTETKKLIVVELAHPLIFILINILYIFLLNLFFEIIRGNFLLWLAWGLVFICLYNLILLFNLILVIFFVAKKYVR